MRNDIPHSAEKRATNSIRTKHLRDVKAGSWAFQTQQTLRKLSLKFIINNEIVFHIYVVYRIMWLRKTIIIVERIDCRE